MRELKQSTAANVIIFMADSTDHITGKTGLTLTVTLSKDGGAFASITPTVTERTNGWYNIALTSSHTDTLGDCVVRATSTGADASERALNVVANIEADSYGIVNHATYGNALLTRTSVLPANFSALSITAGGLVDITQAAADKVWGTAARTLTSFGTLVADVWGYASRLLTAGTNIALAKGTGVTGFNDITATDVKTQVDAALDTAGTELSAIPTTTGTLRQKINYLFQYFRNKRTVTATTETLYKEDTTTSLGTGTVADDGNVFTQGEKN